MKTRVTLKIDDEVLDTMRSLQHAMKTKNNEEFSISEIVDAVLAILLINAGNNVELKLRLLANHIALPVMDLTN